MNIIFMGTPEIAAKNLEKLYEKHTITAVFTQPDKPNSRGNKIIYSAVKEFALANGIPVYQPKSMRTEDTERVIRDLNADIIVIVAYGKIIPQKVIDIPKYGIINLHTSLLPKYRGAAPIHYAILNGDTITGVSVMYINENLDEGDIILSKEVRIDYDDTVGILHDKLAETGKDALIEALELIEKGLDKPIPQNHSEATFTKPIEKDECEVDWNRSKEEIHNFVRGLNPFPVAFSMCNGKRYKIYSVDIIEEIFSGENGQVVKLIKDCGPVIKVSNGGIVLKEVKPENKNMVTGRDLINGNSIKIEDCFGRVKE